MDLAGRRATSTLAQTREVDRSGRFVESHKAAAKSRRTGNSRTSRSRLGEPKVVVLPVIRIPPFAPFDGEANAHDELSLIQLALVVLQLDGEAEPVPTFIAGCRVRDMGNVGAGDFRSCSARQRKSTSQVWRRNVNSLPIIQSEPHCYPFLERKVAYNRRTFKCQGSRLILQFHPFQDNVLAIQ